MKKFAIYSAGVAALLMLVIGIVGIQNTLEFGLNNIRTMRLVVNGDVVMLDGIINAKSYRQFSDMIAENPQITTLVQGEVLGSIDDDVNIKLGYYVRELGLNTHLTAQSNIQSGGVDLFLAGVRRTMEAGAVLGVHSWTDNTVDGADLPRDSAEHDLTKDYIAAMLGSTAFYWFTLSAAPSDGMYFMTSDDVEKYGLVTE